ncbi:hypothetical protein ES705_44407 [subsurface metagenome]
MTEPETIEYKGKIVGRIGTCILIEVPTPDGKVHLEATCKSKEARDHLADILEQESIIRVNPKVILEEITDITPERPPITPAVEPVTEPVTEQVIEQAVGNAAKQYAAD